MNHRQLVWAELTDASDASILLQASRVKSIPALNWALELKVSHSKADIHGVTPLVAALACNFVEGVESIISYHHHQNLPTLAIPSCISTEQEWHMVLSGFGEGSMAMREVFNGYEASFDSGDGVLTKNLRDRLEKYASILPLQLALIHEMPLPTLEALLLLGLEVNQPDEDGYTPLHLACMLGHIESVKLLLKHGASAAALSKTGRLPENLALEGGHNDVVALLEQIPETHRFVQSDNIGALKNVLGTVSLNEREPIHGMTPLHIAVIANNQQLVSLLLTSRVDLFSTDNDGNTALHLAAMHGHVSIFAKLINAESRLINTSNLRSETALHLAVIFSRAKIIEQALSYSEIYVDLTRLDDNGMTAQHIAAATNAVDILSCYQQAGEFMDLLDGQGKTPLHYAVINNNTEAATVLLSYGADPQFTDNDGNTPFSLVTAADMQRTFEYFMQVVHQHDNDAFPFTNLVFQGGSVKGIAYAGAMEQLEASGFDFSKVRNVGGTSAGAITALGISLGLNQADIMELLSVLDFESFLDHPVYKDIFLALKCQDYEDVFGQKAVHLYSRVKKVNSAFSALRFAIFGGVSQTVKVMNNLMPSLQKLFNKLNNDNGLFYGEELRGWFEKLIRQRVFAITST